MKKREVRRAITQYYIGKKVFEAEVLGDIPEEVPSSGMVQLEVEKLKLEHEIKLRELEAAERERERQRQHEIHLKKLEAEEKERERAEKEKQRQHDWEIEKMKNERRDQGLDQAERFNVSRELRLVPLFEETDVDSYFLLFEKVAVNQKWPKEQWVALLQSVLKGKAQRAYAALSLEEGGAENYDEVKKVILRTYKLVPEADRQRFRNLRKGWNQTYTELAHEKGVLLDHWCTAERVGEDYGCLREMFLIEEFKSCVPEEIRVYLNEKQDKSISEFARLADEYVLTHKTKTPSN
ncbi:E3 ubiquitin-protein ligase BRE1A-like [Hypanus sabinus]|uniref:E3 ubiquitin-protein ligase BRE1A-like n=1 Tax=Hypanus sabinus TaxID=79690 RepID=UPI0028C49358|nr:E3 ubiquitin-protein ligase BRE1A-like [Hypanus sabinus]